MSGTKQGDGPLGWILRTAQEEAEAARHGYFGVEHLPVVLARGRSRFVAEVLADHGVIYERARDAVRVVVGSGRGDGPARDAATLLGTLGIDLGEVRRRVEARFGPNAIGELYASSVGWNLRPRGPLCGPQMSPQFKRAVHNAVGRCWDRDKISPQLEERLLLGALDVDSAGLRGVLAELDVSPPRLRESVVAALRIAS
ncbi:MAG: Clp protease N-terminal domain-containing protein [Acidimicrobiales bacterium]